LTTALEGSEGGTGSGYLVM